MLSLLILVPLFAVLALNVFYNGTVRKASFWALLLFSVFQIALSFGLLAGLSEKTEDIYASFLRLHIAADNISIILILCIGIVTFVSAFAAKQLIHNETRRFDFMNLTLLCVAGMNGIVVVKDIFTLYIFIEIAAVSSYILIALDKDRAGLRAAFKYLIISSIATILMITSISLLLMISGTTNFIEIKRIIGTSPDNVIIKFSLGIFLCGLFIKAGIIPFHGWLPDAYSSAPAPVSILLAGIVTKTVGVYSIMRIVISVFGFVPGVRSILLMTGAVSIVFGAFAALGHKDFKRILAYSSISQVGYIILGF